MKFRSPVVGLSGRLCLLVKNTSRVLAALFALYLFICSLTFLSVSFRMLGGRNLSALFSNSSLLSNPVVGVMIGILVTVLVQSSSTSTSIIVSLVSAGVEVRHAVPMILGSNVGTSVTNTIVSMTAASDPLVFSRAFAAATVHDMFNWLSVVSLLSLEMATGFLEKLTEAIVDRMPLDGASGSGGPDILKPLVYPFTSAIVQIDKRVLIAWSMNDPAYANVTSILQHNCTGGCHYLIALLDFEGLNLGDTVCGSLLLIASLTLLILCLLTIMKALNSILGSSLAIFIQKVINAEVPYAPWLTGYIAMLIGAIITILVRSSSIFTSTLTPLCGLGLVSLETAYPMTLGSNIGTTTTSILASFAAEGKYLRPSVQISFVHLFFNIVGILIFYPLPFMRWPLPLARGLGRLTANYRWFALAYLLSMFFFLPLLVFGLSLSGPLALYGVLGPVFALFSLVGLINVLQAKAPRVLPPFLRHWEWLPLPLRSLRPLDNFIRRHLLCCSCARSLFETPQELPLALEEEWPREKETPLLDTTTSAYCSKRGGTEEVAILANNNHHATSELSSS
eukprot:TRINITY_DN5358_c0_g1_i2.p1 TRINITY_DN5358_c0_g1~~TRINITY_DN5358_c0_g1_i2.p1  ORF type:complete len:565 (-),score=167.33 TRINITY_DN5358_c0_g1_i2:76-1770(-)